MTTRKTSLMMAAALAVFVAAGAQLAVAQTGQQSGSAQKGTVARTGPLSRPVNSGALRAPSGPLVSIALSEAECTGIGGKVIDVAAASCGSGKQCVTANADNTTHYKCISVQQ